MRFLCPMFIAGVLSVAQALLLPPTISSSDADIIKTFPVGLEAHADSRVLNLECSNCPVATFNPSGVEWIEGVKSKLQLQFSIAHNEIEILYLNGFQIYPRSGRLEPLAALQISTETAEAGPASYIRLGYELRIMPVVKSKQDQLELIAIHLQIVEIGNKFVDGLENIELKLLRTSSGKLMIGDLVTAPTSNPGGNDCNSLTCRLRTILANKIYQIKPASRCGSKASPHGSIPGSGQRHSDKATGHNFHRKKLGFARFLRGLRSITLHVLVPTLVVISVGLTASLVGMLAGQAIIMIWRVFCRRGQRACYSRVYQDKTPAKEKDQDQNQMSPFLEHQEPPPVYENIVMEDNLKD